MKKLSALLCLFLFSVSGFSQFYWLNPQPQGNYLQSVSFPDQYHGYAVGGGGTILKTSDGGSNWTVSSIGDCGDLCSVFFVDADTGFAMGDFGTFCKTSDGGETWTFSPIFSDDEKFVSSFFINSNIGYVLYYIYSWPHGDIMKTIDGGATWFSVTPSTTTPILYSSYFVNADTGYAVGQGWTIVKTTDGGASWNTLKSTGGTAYNRVFKSVFFTNSNKGYVSGYYLTAIGGSYSGFILRTIDGGATWDSVSTGMNVINSLYFSEMNTGIGVGWDTIGNGIIMKTTDGGTNWTTLSVASSLYSVCFANANNGLAVGKDGLIMKTINAGMGWEKLSNGFRDSLSGVFFTDVETGFIAGRDLSGHGLILKTNNGGTSWDTLLNGTSNPLNSIFFPATDIGYTAGEQGTILKTSDQGANWTALNTGTTKKLYSVYFTNEYKGYAVSDSGMVIKTIDGGNSWHILPTGVPYHLYSINFPTENVGYAVGQYGIILKTSDEGAHWTQVNTWYPGWYNDLYSVSFIDSIHGFVAGENSVIIKTSDGGLTWNYLFSEDYQRLSSVRMTDTSTAYFAGTRNNTWGLIYKVKDNSPYLLTCDVKNKLLSVYFPNASTGYVVGEGGTILKTDNGGGTVGINDNKPESVSLKLFPNPTSGDLTVETPEKGTLSVYNLNGVLLLQRKLTEPSATIDVNTLPTGVYFVKLVGVKGVQVGKFVKQ